MSIHDMPWRLEAACREEDNRIFFPEKSLPIADPTSAAKAVCQDCAVQHECLEYALRHERFGVWGGLSAKQRRLVRIERNIKLKEPTYDWSDAKK